MENNQKFVYADNAATTNISKNVLNAMMPFLTEHYGNPSSIYSIGNDAEKAREVARQQVAKALNAKPTEIFFTSCGSEADNWALKSTAQLMLKKGKNHIITTQIEHHAILRSCEALEKQGFTVTYLPVSSEGYVTAQQVKKAITDKTALVSIMYANNEIGTIQSIKEIGEVCRQSKVIFHTDAVQAVGNVAIDVQDQNIDMLSLSGHKIHAPKGIGVLYVKQGTPIVSFIDGGGQERNKRGGTENMPAIVALGVAISDACSNIEEKAKKVSAMRDKIFNEILSSVPQTRKNGGDNRLAGNVNISFIAVEGEALLLRLGMKGICASSGSACASASLDPSHVLLAIGLPHEVAHGSLRLTLNENNTMEEVDYIIKSIKEVVSYIRSMSPIWQE
ncbi:MAG: cysteine desulfurase NifS [Oscillospiraceae bacterium]